MLIKYIQNQVLIKVVGLLRNINREEEDIGGGKNNDGLSRWFKENWKDIGGGKYPVYRPTKRINKDSPLLVSEIDKKDLKKKIKIKQIIKGDKNLKKFKRK